MFKVTRLHRLHPFRTTKTMKKLLLYMVGRKERNLRYRVTFPCNLVQKHSLGRIEWKKRDRERLIRLQKFQKEFDLEEIKKVI